MGNMIKYVKNYGKYTFADMPLNEVDSLVLSQFSYLKFEHLVPDVDSNGKAVSVLELVKHEKRDTLFGDERYREENTALLAAMAKSRRFRNMLINYHENIIDTQKETQFSAITCFLPDETVYIVFRGTDENIVGWKEDFNMAFSEPVPGQLMSEKYLKYVTQKFEGPFYVGGHSKGGNLAVFASMCCSPEIQKRILKIYSHDGPGFRPEVLEARHYEKIESKVCKILPHSSLVGMLLQNQENYEVVQSSSFGLLQHNPYTWSIRGAKFVKAKDVYHKRKVKNDSLNQWILSMDEEQMKIFVDTLYQIVSACQVDTLLEFGADWKNCVAAIINAMKELDEESKKMLWEIMMNLVEIRTGGVLNLTEKVVKD